MARLWEWKTGTGAVGEMKKEWTRKWPLYRGQIQWDSRFSPANMSTKKTDEVTNFFTPKPSTDTFFLSTAIDPLTICNCAESVECRSHVWLATEYHG
jgi:hypothetical protein